MDYSPSGSSVHRILQAKILELVTIPYSRGSSQFRDWTQVSCIAGRFFTIWATREAPASLEESPLDDLWAFQWVVGFCLLEFCWGFLHLSALVILAYNFLYYCVCVCVCVCVASFSGFGISDSGFVEWVLEVFFLYNVLKEFFRIGVSSSLNFW